MSLRPSCVLVHGPLGLYRVFFNSTILKCLYSELNNGLRMLYRHCHSLAQQGSLYAIYFMERILQSAHRLNRSNSTTFPVRARLSRPPYLRLETLGCVMDLKYSTPRMLCAVHFPGILIEPPLLLQSLQRIAVATPSATLQDNPKVLLNIFLVTFLNLLQKLFFSRLADPEVNFGAAALWKIIGD